MGFEQHHWTDATSLTATELNRIEQGIKSSHDVLDVLGTELTNVQSKQSKLAQEIEDLVSNSPSILETVSSIQRLLDANPSLLSTISNTANIVTTKALDSRLKQYLPLTDIKQNGVSVVHNSVANINTPKVDTILNANSNNPISNSAVAKALANIQTNVPIPTSLADLESDINHRLVTDADKLAWNELLNHNHDDLYAPLSHNHDDLYATLNHNHNNLYATLNHSHNNVYTKTETDALINCKDLPSSITANTDTVTDWAGIQNGIYWVSETGRLQYQPGQWGFVIHIHLNNSPEIVQFFCQQASGPVYHRAGNGAGWSNSGQWCKIFASKPNDYTCINHDVTIQGILYIN